MSARQRHVIVGASAAGVSAALAMRRAGFDGEIFLVDADRHVPYERPPLSKGLLDAEGGRPVLRSIVEHDRYAGEDIELMLGRRVDRLDVGNHTVEFDNGDSLAADRVLLTTGLAARRLPVEGADLPGVLVLRDAADAVELSTQLAAGGPLVVVGAGFIGLEIAAVARAHGIEVTVIELAARPLAGMGDEVGQLVQSLHEDHGVTFVLGASVAQFLGTSRVETVVLSDGRRIDAGAVVVGVGVVPRNALARDAGLRLDAGIAVDRYGVSSNPWISAAGDVASHEHPHLLARGRVEHWDFAMRHGAAVGASMAGTPTADDGVPYAWSDQYSGTLQMFGRPRVADRFVLQRGAEPGRFLGFWLRDGGVGAVVGYDRPRDVRAGKALIEGGYAIPPEILTDPGADLTALHKGLARAARETMRTSA